MEIKVQGASRNAVHRNLILISALDAEEAYRKANEFGRREEVSYDNPQDQLVEIKFRGVSTLSAFVLGGPEDGAEVEFEEHLGVSEEEILRWIPPKGSLWAFRPPDPTATFDPDYSSKEVLREAAKFCRDEHRCVDPGDGGAGV
jgi:hypothetical protein